MPCTLFLAVQQPILELWERCGGGELLVGKGCGFVGLWCGSGSDGCGLFSKGRSIKRCGCFVGGVGPLSECLMEPSLAVSPHTAHLDFYCSFVTFLSALFFIVAAWRVRKRSKGTIWSRWILNRHFSFFFFSMSWFEYPIESGWVTWVIYL